MKIILLFLTFAAKSFCFSEVETISLTIAGESRGEGRLGMIAVSNVIINRYNKGGYEDLGKVCLKPYQFSCWSKGKFTQDTKKIKASKEYLFCFELAEKMVKRQPIENVVLGATHYHTIAVSPYWLDKNKIVAQIKNHVFYKDI